MRLLSKHYLHSGGAYFRPMSVIDVGKTFLSWLFIPPMWLERAVFCFIHEKLAENAFRRLSESPSDIRRTIQIASYFSIPPPSLSLSLREGREFLQLSCVLDYFRSEWVVINPMLKKSCPPVIRMSIGFPPGILRENISIFNSIFHNDQVKDIKWISIGILVTNIMIIWF